VATLEETLAPLRDELASVEAALSEPTVASDPRRLRDLSRRHKDLSEVVAAHDALRRATSDLEAAREMYAESEGTERDQAREEVATAEDELSKCEGALEELLLPRDPNDGRNVIVEIRGAEGGEEANLFAGDLAEMYRRYAALRGWRFEVVEERESSQGGIDEAIFRVIGPDVWARLEQEAGVHRVQRVPQTEAKGRVHTSSATVSVLPEAEEVDIEIDANDLKIDVYRSSGPGGQSVNTTDSAVRITHLPSGIVIHCQQEKSQLKNRSTAMKLLRTKLYDLETQKQQSERAASRKSMVGSGDRSEKIRTYNFPQDRLTDHRVGYTRHNLPAVMDGDVEDMLSACRTFFQAEALRGEA
jgi:peptide chain release factor 1